MRSFKYVTALILMAIAAGAGGAVTKGPSRAGRACLFEGPTNTVATTTTTASAITEVTAAWWFRMDYPSRDFYPILTYRNSSKRLLAFGAQHEPWMYFLDNDSLSVYGSDDSFSAVPGTWWHAAFTWSSSDGVAAFFQNGESRGTQTTAKGLVIPSGGYWLFPDEMWDNKLFGHADEITVWNVRLTAAEVALVANGSTSVHASDRLLHWSCDDDNSTSVADDVSGTPAVVSSSWTSGSSLKVPSTCPNVDTNMTVLLVSAASLAVTNLSLPSGTKILSLPAAGKLLDSSSAAVVVGDSPASVKYVAPSGGLTAETTFATSYANVYLAPNHAPAPKSISTNVKAYEQVDVHCAFFTTDLEPAWDDLYEVDADGDLLTAKITSLPASGTIYQYDGTVISTVPTTITDTGLRFTYAPDNSAIVNDSVTVTISVSDGIAQTSSTHKITVVDTSKSPAPQTISASMNSSGVAVVAIPVSYDYQNQTRLLITAPAQGKLLDFGTGLEISTSSQNVEIYQWVSSVTAYSSQWDSSNAASNVAGGLSTYPSYGNGDGAWAFGTDNGTMQYIEVHYDVAVVVTAVTVYEIYDGDSVTRIAQLSEDGKSWETLFSRSARTTAAPTTSIAFSPTLSMPNKSHAVKDLRIEFQAPVGDWPEIDSIKLVGTAALSVASVPTTNGLVYKSTNASATTSLTVYVKATTNLLDRLSYNFETKYATVQFTPLSQSRAGRACLFEGPQNYATSGVYAEQIVSVTAAWWFRVDYPSRDFYPILTYRNDSNQFLSFGAQHEPWIYLMDDDSYSVYGSDDSFSGIAGQWWHAAFTWSSRDGVVTFYQNGVSRGSAVTGKGLVIPAGGRWKFPDEMWDNKLFGHVDELTIWNRRLSASEVAQVAVGNLAIAPANRTLRWSCDDANTTAIVDEVSGVPATLSASWKSGSSVKVPSTCPAVNTDIAFIRVKPASSAVTTLSLLPSSTTVYSLPSSGTLYVSGTTTAVKVGDAPAAIDYKAPSSGLSVDVVFNSSYCSKVYLTPNHAPVVQDVQTNVKAYEEVSVHAAFFTTDLEPAWDDLYEVDADGDFLTATITSLPSTGKLYQYDGTRITSVPATVTDTGLRFTYVPTDRALIGDNVSVGLSVSDGLSATTLKHIITVTATSKPPQPIDTAATTNSSGYAHVAIPITYDYLNQARLLAKAPSHGKLLDTSFNALNLTTKNVIVHQWVSSVTAYSSQWDSDNAASNVIGAPSTYPAYGNGDGAWAFGDDEGAMEYIEVKFATAVIVTNVTIFEIYDGNSVTRIAQLASDGVTWETLFFRAARTTAAPTTAVAFSPALSMPTTSHAITSLRIEFQVPAGEWPEIDAIKLIGTTQMTVASIPSSDSVIYERATSGPDYVDTFEVITEQTADLLARLSYSFITAYATVTVTVTSESTPSRAGLACLFEGPGNSISSGSYSSTITEITASWWFRMDYPSSDFFPILTYRNASQRLLAFGAQHAPWIYLMEDDSLSVYGTDDSFEPVPGRWYHAAFSWRSSDGQVSFYQDGTSRGSATTAKGFVVPAGGYWTFPDELWDEKLFGHADEITVWNVCLSDSEIALVANGNLTVASENRVLHWSCDDDSNHSVADDVSLIPANISTSWKSSALKVPSTCPEVNVNVTYLAVLAGSSSVTTLTLPSSTTVLSLPTSGKLVISGTSTSVLVGESPAALDYIAPSAGLTSVVSFNTSFSLVYLTPNHAPVIKLFSTSAKAFDTTVLHSAYFNAEGTLTWEDVYSADADGDLLTAKVTSLPSAGQLFQYDGTEITSVPTTLTDSGLRFKFVPLDSALIGDNITLKISVTDGLSTASVTRAITVAATTKPPTPKNTSTSTDETGDATFTIPVSYNYQSQAQLLAMAPSKGKLKNAATGKSLSFATKNVVLHQWAHAVLNYSSQWNENNAATNALNAPVTYPEYGNGESAWAFGDDEGEVEWIELRYDMPVIVTNITVYEIYDGNSVIRIAQRASDGVSWETLFSRAARTTAAPQVAVAFSPALMMPSKSHAVRDIRIEFQVPAGEWPEIDAIKLVGTSEMEVASVPSTNTLLYHRTEMGPTTDSFKVLVEQTEQLISRLSYFTESTLATVSVSITETVSGAGCASVTAVLLLATLASLLL